MASQIVRNATENQRLHLHATRMILQESKDCIKKSIDEVIMEISQYMAAVMGYHDQSYQNTKEIVDNSLEILNETVISFQSALDPYLRTHDDGINYFYRWVAPRWAAQTYRNTICNMANYMAITFRLANAMVFSKIEAFTMSMEQAKKSAKALSTIISNTSITQ
jgi:galactokinase/mevalonate kinase-like predicted kinase